MKRLIASWFFAIALLCNAATVHAQALTVEPLNRIVAVVEEDVILQSELDRAVSNVLTQYARNPQQLPPRAILERQVLERLIMARLQAQRAEATGIRVGDSDIDQALGRLAQQNKMTVSQIRASIEHDGYSFDEFRRTMRDELLVQKLHQRIVQSHVNVTDAEIDILLASNSLKTGEVKLSHILIAIPDGATPVQLQSIREKAESVKKQIDSGMDFSAAAIRYSEGQNALEGGDLGWRRFDEVPTVFADLVQGMSVGQVTQPVRGPSGFHILKLVDKRDSGKQVVSEYHARHIVVKTTELQSSDEALKTIRAIRHRVVDNQEDFAKVAKDSSEDSASANLGGDMGWFPAEQYGTRVAEIITTLKDNEVSEPFQTELGWHIMQRLGSRDTDRTEDVLRTQAKETIRNRKAEEEYDTFLRQLHAESFIDIRLPDAAEAKSTPSATP